MEILEQMKISDLPINLPAKNKLKLQKTKPNQNKTKDKLGKKIFGLCSLNVRKVSHKNLSSFENRMA